MILGAPRVTLRPLGPDDAPPLHSLMSDPEVMAYWDMAEVSDEAVATRILQAQLAEVAAGQAIYWTIRRNADRAFVGCCDLSDLDRQHRRAEIGFMLARRFWGGGYAQEAMHAVISHAALALRLRRLSARTHLGNLRSIALLERLGFSREGVLRGYVERDGERRDCLVMGLLL